MWAASQTVAATYRGRSLTDSNGGAHVDSIQFDAQPARCEDGAIAFDMQRPHSTIIAAGSAASVMGRTALTSRSCARCPTSAATSSFRCDTAQKIQ
jgi:hypothetical protein